MLKKFIASVLAVVLLLGVIAVPASAAENPAEDWFYGQLSEQGQDIYDAISGMFSAGTMQDGVTSLDLIGEGVVEKEVVEAYLDGNRTLFNDFAAAKDAFDLEHPEAWYFDSADLSLRVTEDTDGKLYAWIGPGKTEDYYVDGVAGKSDVLAKSAELERAINDIVSKARGTDYEKVKYVHDQITHSISYRFENECKKGNAGFIRTAYALVTHEGVCEGYARSFQYALNKLGIPCVLIHGVQTSGSPEDHMWTAVQLTDSNTKVTAWYVVDPTWDDPIALDKNGNVKPSDGLGTDGGETETYLLVGQDVVGANWQPLGAVSTGVTEFEYPEIALRTYGKGELERNGLKVEYDTGLMEGSRSTVYRVSFNGDGLVQSAKKGYYFLVKMYKVRADGSVNAFEDWYYSVHGLHGVQSKFDPDNDFKSSDNSYYCDSDEYMTMEVSNCDYVEFAITTKAPPNWQKAEDLLTMDGYYSGDYTDILAETGLLYNINGSNEPAPYIKNASPGFNTSISAGQNYRIHVEFTDSLYHPDAESVANAAAGKVNDAEKAMGEAVTMDYKGTTYDWGMAGRKPHQFSVKPDPKNLEALCETHGSHSALSEIGATCLIYGLEYDFTSSTMWADDSVQHEFFLTGLVGKKSNKYPNTWSYVFENKYPFWTCPLYSGYQWNLWGHPQALDNPNDLDLSKMAAEGVGDNVKNLQDLHDSMNLDINDMNGRITLVVENSGGNRDRSEELANALGEEESIPAESIVSSSLYEIDFARVCRCTIVETGQTLRLCVGFPEGIDPSMEGLVFKAYHFTRDIEKSCSEKLKPADQRDKNHVHTGEIYSVEEIPCTVTALGLVITCQSFSPFEIVALDADAAGLEVPTERYAIITNDGHGSVELVGETTLEDVGDNIVAIGAGETRTFKVTPQDGYEVEAVMIGGQEPLEVKGNTFTVSYDNVKDGNALINVTFVPETIKQQDEENGQSVLIPTACEHKNTSDINYVPATCTKDGHMDDLICEDCGMTLSAEAVIPKTGHVSMVKGATPADCEHNGSTGDTVCSLCGITLSKGEVLPATGHNFVDGVCTECNEAQKPASGSGDSGNTGDNKDPQKPSGGTGGSGSGDVEDPGDEEPDNEKPTIPAQYTDVPADAWYYGHMAKLYQRGLIVGTTGTTMSPKDETTRAQILTVLWNLTGSPIEGANSFTDVKPDAWYAKVVNWGAKNNIIAGYENGQFGPNDPITREQMLVVLRKYASYAGLDVSVSPGAATTFTDSDKISDWAERAVVWGYTNDIISGHDDGSFKPRDGLTRAEMTVIVSKLCDMLDDAQAAR